MFKVLSMLSPIGIAGSGPSMNHHDDDVIDKLNHDATVIILIIFALVVRPNTSLACKPFTA